MPEPTVASINHHIICCPLSLIVNINLKTQACLQQMHAKYNKYEWRLIITHKHTHTHTHRNFHFTALWTLAGWAGTRTNLDFTQARDSERQWHQLGHMQICTLPRQITTPAPQHSVFYRPDALFM